MGLYLELGGIIYLLTYLLLYGDVCIWDANWVTYLGRIFGGAYQQHFTV